MELTDYARVALAIAALAVTSVGFIMNDRLAALIINLMIGN